MLEGKKRKGIDKIYKQKEQSKKKKMKYKTSEKTEKSKHLRSRHQTFLKNLSAYQAPVMRKWDSGKSSAFEREKG